MRSFAFNPTITRVTSPGRLLFILHPPSTTKSHLLGLGRSPTVTVILGSKTSFSVSYQQQHECCTTTATITRHDDITLGKVALLNDA